MADTYTAQGLIKPEPGSSLNTWGTKLNENMIDLVVAMLGDGTVNCAAGGTISVAFSDGDDTAAALPFLLKLTGSPAAAFNLQLPAVDKYWVVWNATGQTATVKVSGGSGVSLSDGDLCLVMYSATAGDIIAVTPNRLHGALTVTGQIHGVTAGTATTDAVNKAQLDAAIAGVTTAGDGTVKAESTATSGKFLGGGDPAIKASSSGAAFTTRLTGGASYVEAKLKATSTITASTTSQVGGVCSVDTSGAAFTLYLPSAGINAAALESGDVVVVIDNGGALDTNNVTLNGNGKNIEFADQSAASTLALDVNFAMFVFVYNGTQWVGTGHA